MIHRRVQFVLILTTTSNFRTVRTRELISIQNNNNNTNFSIKKC